ncbi:MAG: hypothetical protein COA77_05190 [Thaumarchaeota archaeon]|nr:MAG: hypothetical protein COA77_05190 [Nitrososphaerota archaeon]
MEKTGLVIIASGAIIVIGLVLLALGNQVILDSVNQEDGKVSINQDIIVSTNIDSKKTSIGIFAVQVIDIKENIFSAKILDPLGIEIIALKINEETIEEKFDVIESGMYKLVIQSSIEEKSQVFGAIGPLPDEGKKIISFISVYVVIIGMIGLFGAGILKIKKRSI